MYTFKPNVINLKCLFIYQKNPSNCEMMILRHDGCGRLEFEGRCELDMEEQDDDVGKCERKEVIGFRFYKKLKVVPKQHRSKRTIRIAYEL
mmetsp:Transcript_28854/g.33162  ORF Transcript_28854/g.33162 Transcript_28854/m.33162 type:complete len:91 (-) Transcript_28854:130-402(-)